MLATGQLHQPAIPQIAGVETFAGHSFHSSQWDHAHRLEGRRVAVVGTGASAVQFIPEIAPVVRHLTVFQRTGNWFLPRRNRRYPPLVRAAVRWIPGVQALRVELIANIDRQVVEHRAFGDALETFDLDVADREVGVARLLAQRRHAGDKQTQRRDDRAET